MPGSGSKMASRSSPWSRKRWVIPGSHRLRRQPDCPLPTTGSGLLQAESLEDGIDMSQVVAVIEQLHQFGPRQHGGHLRVGLEQDDEVFVVRPGVHGMLLDDPVG